MNKLFAFLSVLIIMSASAQESVKLYPYKMNPRNHPDDLRHWVRTPDSSLWNNKVQFMALRDMSGDFKSKIDRWVDKEKLGDILWVTYGMIYQKNLEEVVAEIKKRDLYLFDLWGYVPGSGPGGYWTQFQIPDGVLDLFNSELGEKWLGMDNGEQDGRYVSSFAGQLYPLNSSREQQYFNFQRHFERMGDELGNKLATLVSLNFGHYFMKEGIYTLIGAETAQGLPNAQIYYSYIRGAGKQYGVPWFGNASVWNRWGWKNYEGNNNDGGGDTKGTSTSLLKRLIYTHILYNCVAVGFEGSFMDGNDKLSPIGKIQQNAVKWAEKWGDPGVMHTPVAVMTDFMSGWSFPRHLYSGDAYKVWGNLPYETPDYLTDGVLDKLYPGYQDASYYRNEKGFVAPTPYGDIADCLLSDAPEWILSRYPVVVIADKLQPNVELNDKLEAYVAKGGHLVITAGSLAELKNGIAGVTTCGKTVKSPTSNVEYNGRVITEKEPFDIAELKFPSSAKVVMSAGGAPVVVEATAGRGKVTILASPYGVHATPQCPLPVKVSEEKPLDKPFPLLAHADVLLGDIFASQEIFDTNKDLSMVTCYRGDNEYTVLISNELWTEQPFEIKAKAGQIASIAELPIDCAEQRAVGYTPEVVKDNIGKNSKNKIAGGDVRIFRVKLSGANTAVMPEVTPTKNPTNRALVLGNVLNLKEEILSRPTFFQNFDRAVVDWKYLRNREQHVIEAEKGWFERQKLKITVDLTSGINLFPDLRLTNNDAKPYEQSMEAIRDVIRKMALVGADQLIVAGQRTIENNFSRKAFDSSILVTLQTISDLAAESGIDVIYRPSVRRFPVSDPTTMSLEKSVDRKNFNVALPICMILDQESINPSECNAKFVLVSAPERDIHKQLWNTNLPINRWVDGSNKLKTILGALPADAQYIMDGNYDNADDEYLDVKLVNSAVK